MSFVKKLEMELDQVHKAQSELGYMVLDKPLRDGWYKTYKLREDIKRTKLANVYQEVLDAVLIEIWGREKKYADRNWDLYFKNGCRNFQRPGIKRLSEREFLKLSSKAKKYFICFKIKTFRGYRNVYSCRLPKYFFQLGYRRAYIVSYKIVSSVLESREQEIFEILSRSELHVYSRYFTYKRKVYHCDPRKRIRRKTKITLRCIGLDSNNLNF